MIEKERLVRGYKQVVSGDGLGFGDELKLGRRFQWFSSDGRLSLIVYLLAGNLEK